MVLTKQQKRAKIAYDRVKEDVTKEPEKIKDAYVKIAKRFPALVHNCGLVQAVAFVEAKKEDEKKEKKIWGVYLSHIIAVLNESEKKETVIKDLGEVSRTAGLMEYQRLSRNVIASATWIKRYAEALLGEE